MTRIIKVAAAQLGPIQKAEDRKTVVERLLNLLCDAKKKKCDLVVFPELALTTFFPRYYVEDHAAMDNWFENDMPNAIVEPLFNYAKTHEIGFSIGYAEKTASNERYNTSILVDKKGDIIGKYRKIHLPGHSEYETNRRWQHLEKRYFKIGNLGFPVWRTMGGIIGMCICNDRRWPETFRIMGLQGVELVMLGYNTPKLNSLNKDESEQTRMHQNHLCMQAGAYQNACWVVGAAKAGNEDGFALMGGSCIVNPAGEIVAIAKTEEDEIIASECDLDDCNFPKETLFNFNSHRQISHYKLICSQAGVKVNK
tara:strand:+ start:919 stop:1848 length:930 start_codon:yes stop_codon:yes gene_type:complete